MYQHCGFSLQYAQIRSSIGTRIRELSSNDWEDLLGQADWEHYTLQVLQLAASPSSVSQYTINRMNVLSIFLYGVDTCIVEGGTTTVDGRHVGFGQQRQFSFLD